MNDIFRFMYMLSFFPVAYLLAKILFGKGLESYGLIFFNGWYKNLGIGLSIGFIGWCLLYGVRIIVGEYTVTGTQSFTDSLIVLIMICAGFLVGSLISDMIVRGLVFHHFGNRVSFGMLILIATILYTLDDIWLEGLTVNNFIFSACLGISLAYAFYKTHSIWANTGLHAGLNIAYGLFFGVTGNVGDGIIQFKVVDSTFFFSSWLSSFFALVLFLIIYMVRTWFVQPPVSLEATKTHAEYKEGQKIITP
ncbi:CPBP family glutamic-type intramembrane protease [Paenisporosarcina sp. NPDC076898]